MENDKWDIVRIGIIQGTKRHKNDTFWTTFSKVKKLQKCFCKNCYSSGALGGAVFIFQVYLRDIVLMIPTDFCADMSNGSKDIAIYDKFQNVGHVVQPILAKLISFDSAWPKESIDTNIIIFGMSRPIGVAVPNFGSDPQIMVLMKRTKFCFDWSKLGRDTASEPILGRL